MKNKKQKGGRERERVIFFFINWFHIKERTKSYLIIISSFDHKTKKFKYWTILIICKKNFQSQKVASVPRNAHICY